MAMRMLLAAIRDVGRTSVPSETFGGKCAVAKISNAVHTSMIAVTAVQMG